MRYVFRLPDVGEGIAHADIVEYLVKVGDTVEADQMVLRIETDKAVVELPAPVAGTIVEIPFKPGDTASVGDPLLVIETEAEAAEAAPTPEPEKPRKWPEEVEAPVPPAKAAAEREAAREALPEPSRRVLATPHTRKIARELNVDINAIKGSGPHGRITDDDVRKAASEVAAPAP